jgi:2'-5' RNA ligase
MAAMNCKQFLVNEKRKKYDYSSLLIQLPDEITDNVICWGYDNVPNEDVFLNPNDLSFGRENDPHITLMYGIHTENSNEVSDLFMKESEFECKLGKIDLFTKNDNFEVLIVSVESDELHKLNLKTRRNLEATENFPVFIPHITICYMKKGKGKKYIGNNEFLGEKFIINEILFSSKNGDKKSIKLGKNE